MALHRLSLRVMRDGLRARSFSCESLAGELLAHTHEREAVVRAWAWLDPAAVMARARTADGAGPGGTLHGVALGIKDIVHVRGMPTGMGSPVYAGYMPERSATVVQRLEAVGAIVFGKTVTAELAYFHPGATRNPWNPAHTPGGSSMGSAAAVASGMVPAALGTQTNGSVIRPAAFCGCVGYKPSAGLASRTGILEFSRTLDQVGVFARTVVDAAVVASVLVGHDSQDTDSIRPETGFAEALRNLISPTRPPRLVAVRSPAWHLADADQQENFLQSVATLRRVGTAVEAAVLPDAFLQAHDMHRTIMYYEGARTFAALQEKHRDRLSAELNRLIDDGARITEAAYYAALESRTRLQGELGDFLRRYDALLTLPARGEAPATLEHTGDPAFCTLWTLCGVPALTIPSGLGAHGMPLGLQLVGGYLQDARLLQVALWCEEAIGFRGNPPEL